MSVMLTMTGPNNRGRVVETLRARSRLVASIAANMQDSDESGETCSIVCFPLLPPVDVKLTVLSLVLTSQAEALTQRVVQNPSKGCVVHSECTAYGPEHLLVGVGQLRLYVKVGRSDGTKTAAT